jgi:hypothetical protein
MQDFNYWRYGTMEVLVEMSCCKYPPADQLQQNWLENQKSLIDYLKFANTGVRGVIMFANGLPAQYLTVNVSSRQPFFKTNRFGEYYRILLPGVYKLTLMFNCDSFYETTIEIAAASRLQVLNITLDNNAYTSYQNYKLNRYGLFCNPNASFFNINPSSNASGLLNESPKFESMNFLMKISIFLLSNLFIAYFYSG